MNIQMQTLELHAGADNHFTDRCIYADYKHYKYADAYTYIADSQMHSRRQIHADANIYIKDTPMLTYIL